MSVQQQLPQLQQSIPLQNYVYIQDVNKQFSNELTSLVATHPIQSNAITYNLNSMGILEGVTSNGYSIQHLNVPSVHYQTFSVPINQPNGLVQPITGECSLLVESTDCHSHFFIIISCINDFRRVKVF